MNPGETILRSPLEKPLGELTEEDIAQLTREDCRRFLKEKGMRRPSWNKSQAIQQVISLKALLEACPDSDAPSTAGIHQKPSHPPPPVALPSQRTEASGDLQTAAPAKDPSPSPYRRRDPMPPSSAAGDASGRFQVAGREQLPPEGAAADAPVGQMTIFYDGKVNVYDGVPGEKAQAIMQLAASPGFDDAPAEPVQSCRPLPCRFTQSFSGPGLGHAATAVAGVSPNSTAGKLPTQFRESVQDGRFSRETEPEGPTSRKASLQRYFEKRKDRFKGKRVIGGSSSNMEMLYLNQKFRGQNPNEQLIRSSTSSPTQPRPPRTPTRSSSIDNKESKIRISIDLNEEGDGN